MNFITIGTRCEIQIVVILIGQYMNGISLKVEKDGISNP